MRAAEGYAASTGVRARVTIIDNASRPAEAALLRAARDAAGPLELRLERRNLGYGAAANRALAGSAAELVCVSNADVVPAPEMLARLAAVALGDPRAGLVAPRLLGAERGYHAALPRPATLPLRAFAGSLGHRPAVMPAGAAVAEVGQPGGACLLLRAELWRALGGFDPGFFLWFEDVDLARRAVAAGFRNLVVGDAVARHAGAEAFTQLDGPTRQHLRLDGLQRYARRHHPRWAPVVGAAVRLARPLRTRGRPRAGPGDLPPADPGELAG